MRKRCESPAFPAEEPHSPPVIHQPAANDENIKPDAEGPGLFGGRILTNVMNSSCVKYNLPRTRFATLGDIVCHVTPCAQLGVESCTMWWHGSDAMCIVACSRPDEGALLDIYVDCGIVPRFCISIARVYFPRMFIQLADGGKTLVITVQNGQFFFEVRCTAGGGAGEGGVARGMRVMETMCEGTPELGRGCEMFLDSDENEDCGSYKRDFFLEAWCFVEGGSGEVFVNVGAREVGERLFDCVRGTRLVMDVEVSYVMDVLESVKVESEVGGGDEMEMISQGTDGSERSWGPDSVS